MTKLKPQAERSGKKEPTAARDFKMRGKSKRHSATPILLSIPQLKVRGWTPAMIKRFLSKHDDETSNRHHRSGQPMRLYKETRVLKLEEQPQFQEAKRNAEARSKRSKEIPEKKTQELLQAISLMPVPMPILDFNELRVGAIAHYNEQNSEHGKSAAPDSDKAFLDRITVNYVRHSLTQYECELEMVARRIGAPDARLAISERVLEAIAEVYLELASECYRQISVKQEQDMYSRSRRGRANSYRSV
jgi:hypothetical protein